MQAIIFCGIQASGKSSFYKENFFNTHVRISMDLLRTRNRENIFLKSCLMTKQRFVVDNTNPTREERQKYIQVALEEDYEIIGYFFDTRTEEAVQRNNSREGKFKIPEKGIYGTKKRLELPSYEEGFHFLYKVTINAQGGFDVLEWGSKG